MAWPQTWPLPTIATKLAPAQIWPYYREAWSLQMGMCTQLHTDAMQEAPGLQLMMSASVTVPHCCACLPMLAASLTTTPGREGRRGLLRGGDVQPVVLFAPYSPIHMQTKRLSQHHPVLQAEPNPSQKPAKFFMLKRLQTTNHRHKQKNRKENPPMFFLALPEMEPSIKNEAAGIYYNWCRQDSHSQSVCALYSLSDESEEFTKFPFSALTFVKD